MAKAIHRVRITITQDCDDKPMTNDEIIEWVKKQFDGCEYGTIEVDSAVTAADTQR